MRKNTLSTLLVLSAAIALVLSVSPLVISNILLQPVQAQTTMTFKTPTPAQDSLDDSLTFDANGTTSAADPQSAEITNGTIQLQTDQTYTGGIYSGSFTKNARGEDVITFKAKINNLDYSVYSNCSTSDGNPIHLSGPSVSSDYFGPVECSPIGGGSTASSSMTGTKQDSDGDGIPDSSDRCANNSNTRCYKESK
jgi:hypothetical protein